ncbi:hypothetical protein NMY22_g15676 [Coprinellus aureogranulatus]|nr:hypothetical protein NMY22_g15676 [Coprinellus aureogranulatus]
MITVPLAQPCPPPLPSFPNVPLLRIQGSPQSTPTHKASCTTDRPKPLPAHFPCVEAHKARESRITATKQRLLSEDEPGTGPEPSYARPNPTTYHVYHHSEPFPLVYYPKPLPSFDIAYETWGTLSPEKDNVILIHTGLSASSHAASTPLNPAPGWWEKFIGPDKPIDTNKYFVICTNVLGGCYGSTGPSSIEPETGKPWATRFPIVSIFDMVKAQFHLLDHLGIKKLYASVGCSMGAMQSLAAGWLFPARVGKVVSISGTARSSPSAVAMRFAQRSVLMADPNWNNGFYYDSVPPHTGMKLARQIATITYRSGPEWDLRFGRQLRATPPPDNTVFRAGGGEAHGIRTPALCPDFLIETYLDHQGEQFCLKYDANSLLYVSKAMDLFDMTAPALQALKLQPLTSHGHEQEGLEDVPPHKTSHSKSHPPPVNPPPHLNDLAEGMKPLANIPTLVLGVQSDILFTVEQQREVADALRMAGNENRAKIALGIAEPEETGTWKEDPNQRALYPLIVSSPIPKAIKAPTHAMATVAPVFTPGNKKNASGSTQMVQTTIVQTTMTTTAPAAKKGKKRMLALMDGVQVDLQGELPFTPQVMEALRQRVIQLEDQLAGGGFVGGTPC